MSIKRLVLSLTLIFSTSAWLANAQDVAAGEKLFKANCKSCHAINEQVVGPALKDVDKRKDEAWLIKWVKNSQAVIKSGDPYGVALFKKYNSVMTSFENLSDEEIKSILAYIKNPPAAPVIAGKEGPKEPTSGDDFYNGYTLGALWVICIIMLLIAIVLFRIKKVVDRLYEEKFPVEAAALRPHPHTTLRYKLFTKHPIVGVLLVGSIFMIILMGYGFDYGNTEVGVQKGYAPTQPIAFSHKLHAGDWKIDCQYCHNGASRGKFATVPAPSVCMNCHKAVQGGNASRKVSPEIQKIYNAVNWDPETKQYDESKPKTPIKWIRVHNLPDHVYFPHAQHVNVGKIACQKCHGEVQKMEVVSQHATLQMGWCIDCHRETSVDVQGNKYYEKLHAQMKKDGQTDITVAKNGGMECSKCHY